MRRDDGFTIVETLLAISVATVMIVVLFSVTFNYYAQAIQSQEAADLALESQTILSQMVEDLRLASGVGATNQITDLYAQPYSTWSTNDYNNVMIIQYPAVDSSRNIIYDSSTGFPFQNEFVYFINGTTMYKRILKNTSATGNTATTTCPPQYVTSSCPLDRLFSTNINDLSFVFYDTDNAVTADPTMARSISLSVSLSKKVFGKTISLSNSTQITQRNQ